jgi:ParB-like chromosome segregation protein Spo0J
MSEPRREPHPLADLFPLLTGADFDVLVADIRAHGVREPITLHPDGRILDGRNRYRAAQAAGVPCPERTYQGTDFVAFVVSTNLNRRHLTDSQRALVAARLATMRQGERTDLPPYGERLSQADAAKLLHASKRTVERATHVLDSAAPELVAAVEAGTVRVATAAVIADAPPERQRAVVALSRDAILKAAQQIKREQRVAREDARAAAAAEALKTLPRDGALHRVIHADLRDADVPDASVDWIITDPPYGQEFLPVYEHLSHFAARVLKPTGGCVVLVGQSYLPEVLAALGTALAYRWAGAYELPRLTTQIFDRKILCRCKLLLWFERRDAEDHPWVRDFYRSPPNDAEAAKAYHHWGQSEGGMRAVVEACTKPGDVVCDPFCGGGTTGVVAVALGRRFIGVDIDTVAVGTTLQRLAALQDAS